MARLRCDFFSSVLGLSTSMTVLLPHDQPDRPAGDPPVLYLLHGLSDDDTAWTRFTAIERYADGLGLAVVMPQVHRSFYTDEAHGNRYGTFLRTELPELVRTMFRVAPDRERTFVAGLSMGGFGALAWALGEPDRFAAAASLSGALDLAGRQRAGWGDLDPAVVDAVFGDRDLTDTADDLLARVRAADPARLPALYVACGTGDFLYPENVAFIRTCREAGVALTVHEGPGEHDWAYWDARIRDVLAWLPLP